MRAGQLRTPVQVLQPVLVGGIQTWNTPASVLCQTRANVRTDLGIEQPAGDGPPNELRTTVSMRVRPGVQILPRMRIAVTGTTRLLEIDAVDDVELRHQELVLSCREVSA